MVLEAHRAGHQIGIHGNGAAAIDDIIDAFREAQRQFPRPDARHRIEHCQNVREDQLDAIKELGITPSFFVGHVYYWGDRHRDIFLGPERGARISPLASALKRGIRFTVHDDTPVTPVHPLQLVTVAATRQTTSGKVLGPEQRIPVLQALRAITIDAAWQNFEEATKGSIEPGKLADFVILAENPLTVDATRIKDIRVLETVVGGKSVFKRDQTS
jgi:predicted amidohydrolase YtcJ